MPNSGELKVYCDAIRERRFHINSLGQLRKTVIKYLPPDDTPGRRANLFVPVDSPQYEVAREWTLKADAADWRWDEGRKGLWVNCLASPLSGMKCEGWNTLKVKR
jgi:hypothetical protein